MIDLSVRIQQGQLEIREPLREEAADARGAVDYVRDSVGEQQLQGSSDVLAAWRFNSIQLFFLFGS